MKYFLLLILAFTAFAEQTPLFELDLTDGLSQFSKWQESGMHAAKVAKDIKYTEDDVITFTDSTRYSGIITSDWIESPSKNYQIVVYFRGTEEKKTGGSIWYESQDKPNILVPIATDTTQFVGFYTQKGLLDTADGTWQQYIFYLNGPSGIKIYLEQGSYFNEGANYCAFKDLVVNDIDLGTECPGDGEQKILRSYYFGQQFTDKNFKERVQPYCQDNGESVDIRFIYPAYYSPCVETDLFALNADGKVIEKFQPELFSTFKDGYEESRIFTYNLTLSELNDYGCELTEINGSGTKQYDEYKCPVKQFFYLDYGHTFTTRQIKYDWVLENSYVIYTSSFTVLVEKETSTLFNSFIKTYVDEQICGDECYLDMSLTLELLYKGKDDDDYKVPADPTTVVWGDYMNFKIKSTPSDYDLSLMKIFVQTMTLQSENDKAYINLGQIFIDSFIQNQDSSTQGELTFEMMASGEAGLDEGKPFNLKFLVKSDASRRLLEEEENRQSAQMNEASTFKTNKDENNSAIKLAASLIFLAFLLLF